MNPFALLGLAIKYGPTFIQIVRLLAPVLKEAAPLFKQLAKSMPSNMAAQLAVATAAPYIETPRVDPLTGKKLLPGALTVEEEMGLDQRLSDKG